MILKSVFHQFTFTNYHPQSKCQDLPKQSSTTGLVISTQLPTCWPGVVVPLVPPLVLTGLTRGKDTGQDWGNTNVCVDTTSVQLEILYLHVQAMHFIGLEFDQIS